MKSIIQGIHKFQTEVLPKKRALFDQLSKGQKPAALVISCADSRVDMQLVTQAEPGQLFFFRNAGNIVPPYGTVLGAISATIEYAMVALEIPNIIVCGHSDCGAMKGVLNPESLGRMPTVAQWLKYADVARQMASELHRDTPPEKLLDYLIQENVLAQLDNLGTHPSVAVRVARGEVQLHGWIYDINTGSVVAYDGTKRAFVPVDTEPLPHATPLARIDGPASGRFAGR